MSVTVNLDEEWPAPKDPALTGKVVFLRNSILQCIELLEKEGHPFTGPIEIIDKPFNPDDADPILRNQSTYGAKWTQDGNQYGDFVEDWKSEENREAVREMQRCS